MSGYKEKYLKYKTKYLSLKSNNLDISQKGGGKAEIRAKLQTLCQGHINLDSLNDYEINYLDIILNKDNSISIDQINEIIAFIKSIKYARQFDIILSKSRELKWKRIRELFNNRSFNLIDLISEIKSENYDENLRKIMEITNLDLIYELFGSGLALEQLFNYSDLLNNKSDNEIALFRLIKKINGSINLGIITFGLSDKECLLLTKLQSKLRVIPAESFEDEIEKFFIFIYTIRNLPLMLDFLLEIIIPENEDTVIIGFKLMNYFREFYIVLNKSKKDRFNE